MIVSASDPTPEPPIRAIGREAHRLADADATARTANGVSGDSKSGKSKWSRVRDVEGEEILLTRHGSAPETRYVVRGTVNDSGLTVLNLTDPAIPAAVTEEFVDAAWSHPQYFKAQATTVRVNRHLSIEAGDVLLDGRKVAELAQVVERVARTNVAEIRLMRPAVKEGMACGALVGAGAGVAFVMGIAGPTGARRPSHVPI